MSKKRKHYLDNEEFKQMILEYKKLKEQNPDAEIPPRLLKALQKLIDKVARRANFCGYQFLRDMKQEAMYYCLRALERFNPTKSDNAFAYFTSVVWNAFISVIMKEKEYVKFKFEYAQFFMTDKEKKRDYRVNEEYLDEMTRYYLELDEE